MNMINLYLLLLIVMTGLVSCANEVRPAFEEMEDAELAYTTPLLRRWMSK
jgi:hypothetical protein